MDFHNRNIDLDQQLHFIGFQDEQSEPYATLYNLITTADSSDYAQPSMNYIDLLKHFRFALSNPSSAVRITALELLLRLLNRKSTSLDAPSSSLSQYSLCLQNLFEAELCPADFQNHRQRGQIVRRLKFSTVEKLFENATISSEEKGSLYKIIFGWLLAQFYERFTLYWPLLFEPIESYAQGMSNEGFWDCFEHAMDHAWSRLQQNQEKNLTLDANQANSPDADYDAYRLQLLRLLIKLPVTSIKTDQRTRYLVPKFILLYREEFMHFDAVVNSIDEENEMDGIVKSQSQEKNDAAEKQSKLSHPINFHLRRKGVLSALKAMLTLFSHLKNPTKFYKEEEIRDIYYELLLVNEAEVQRLALACLCTYKHSWLMPYKESLEGLLDEKRLRDQLVLFSVDQQQTIAIGNEEHGRTVGKKSSRAVPLLEQHRANLMPILLRLLYGTLHTHTTHRGKAKRIAIFRFLASCSHSELTIFLNILFGPLLTFFEYSSANKVDIKRTLNSLDSKQTVLQNVSLNKLKSFLGTLSDVFRLLGATLDASQLSNLFTVLLLSGRIILLRMHWISVNSDGSEIDRQLRNLRLLCMQTIIKFLRTFHTHQFLPVAGLECMFQQFVSPLISAKGTFIQTMDETANTPNTHVIGLPISVCHLFCLFAKIQRYHPLLNVPFVIEMPAKNKATSSNIQTTPLSLLCDQLLQSISERIPKPVHTEILRVCCILLDSPIVISKEEDEIKAQLPQGEIIMDCEDATELSYGTRLVLTTTNLDKILAHLSLAVGSDQLQKTIKISKIPSVYLDLLSRLSTHIHRPELGTQFAHTLLHYVTNRRGILLRRQKSEKAQNLLATLTHLTTHLEEPLDAISRIGPLFSQLEGRQLRESLAQLASSFIRNKRLPAAVHKHLERIEAIESWDPRRIDEPDADRRCEALLQLHEWYEQKPSGKLQGMAELLPMFIHSHAHSIIFSNDLSLRGTSANCFRQLIAFIADPDNCKQLQINAERLIRSHIIPLILRGFKTNATKIEIEGESVRYEFTQCLVQLLRSFPADPYLSDLRAIGVCYGDNEEEADSQMNFFEEAVHIQAHRKQRAFGRLAERLNRKDLKVSHLPLLNFILPIVEPYLMETAPNRAYLCEQALRLFTAILRQLPWAKYDKLLEHYLRQVDTEERTKPVIRVIIAILDAFHFDLREYNLTREQKQFIEKSTETATQKKVKKQVRFAKAISSNDEEETQKHSNEEKKAELPEETLIRRRQKIFTTVTKKLLPRLRDLLRPQTKMDSHRRAQQFAANCYQHEDEKLLRAPLVIAAVKLMKWLPSNMQEQNLNNFLFALNHLLMSRSSSVREGARKLMVQVVKLLGPKHFPSIIRELKQTMNKGYQIHVMVYTIHTLIKALEQQLKPGSIDTALGELIEICKWETFGNSQLEEEKQPMSDGLIKSDSHGVPEAKANNKTAETLTQIGRFIGGAEILDEKVLGQIREIIDANPKSETLRKASEWLVSLAAGLRLNMEGIPPLRQIRFAFLLARNNLTRMVEDQERIKCQTGMNKMGSRPASCLLLAPEPKRLGVIQKVAIKSRVHVFVEFALQIFADQLKKRSSPGQHPFAEKGEQQQVKPEGNESGEEMDEAMDQQIDTGKNASSEEMGEILAIFDQFAVLLLDALKQKYDKIIALSLRCLLNLFKYPLKSLKERESELVERLFVILADYAAMGQAGNQPHVLELQQHLFKCFTRLIKDASLTLLGGERMQLLLNYVETDILDTHKQATAFNLIKAIIVRKVDKERISHLIEYLSETAITTFSANIRSQCRQVILLYLTVHPEGQQNYEHWMNFFLNQLEYELEDGRLSALEMVFSILDQFTEEANSRYALMVCMKLATRLVNDPNERCQQFVALCLRKLLCSITDSAFNDVHAAAMDWLAAKKPAIRVLAWRTFTQFVLADSPHFTPSLIAKLMQKVYILSAESNVFHGENSIAIKLTICELLQAIAEKTPSVLNEVLLRAEEKQFGEPSTKASSNDGIKKSKRKQKKRGEEKETTSMEAQQPRQAGKFTQFFENLQNSLLSCRQPTPIMPNEMPAQRLQLSIAAATFLTQLLDHPETKEAFMQKLKSSHQKIAIANENEESPAVISTQFSSKPLFSSFCLNIVSLLDVRQPKQNRRRTAESPQDEAMDQQDGIGNSEEVDVLSSSSSQWDDKLADLAIRLLSHLAPALGGEHFELLCKRLSKLCWDEAAKEPDKARKRLCIMKLVGVLVLRIPPDSVPFHQLCSRFLPLLYREISKKSPKFTDELHSLATEVADQFKQQLGDRQFSTQFAQCQKERAQRKQQRKEEMKAKFVTDPAAAIVEKQRRHKRKQAARMRRLDELKPYRAFKRRRREEAIRRAESPPPME